MIKKPSVNIEVASTVILFFILWTYLLLRIINVPFLEDEIATWFIYVNHGKLLPMSGYVDANNHIVNSSLAWIFAQFFDPSPAILRLPNFLFFPVYFFYSYKTSQRIQNKFVRLAVFLGLVMAHHVFDFFGLCRGYGISMGLLLMTCFYLVNYFTDHHFWHLVIALICSFFMVWANLSLLGTAYIFLALISLNVFIQKTTKKQKTVLLLFLFVCFALILGYATWYALHLQKIGKLYLGKTEGSFVGITVLTLFDVLFRTKSMVLFFIAVLFVVLVAADSVIQVRKNGFRAYLNNPNPLYAHLLFGNILLIFLSHWFLGVVYPQERATLYLFPMLLIAVGFSADHFIQTFGTKYFVAITTPLLLIPFHFLFSLNLDYTAAYRWESYPERYIRYIEKNSSLCDVYPIVGIYDEDRWVYNSFRGNGKIPIITQNTYPDTVADFQIGKFEDHPQLRSLYDSLDYDSRNDFLLLKRKVFLKRTQVLKYENLTTKGITSAEYFNFVTGERNDSLTDTHFLYYFDLVISSPQRAFEGFVISSLKDTQIYEVIALDRVAEHWEKRRIQAGVIIREDQSIKKIPFAYFWNKKKVPFIVEEGSLTIYSISR